MRFNQPISVIIPTFNEAKNIGRVLKVLKNFEWIDEIIVVDDYSSDNTVEIIESFNPPAGGPNLVIAKNSKNLGKGGALVNGIKKAKNDLLLFLDADLIGLKEEHLLKILAPIVFTREADLVLGVFMMRHLRKHAATKIANRAFPSITGQRAIWKKRRLVVKLEGLSQKIKEEKGDLAKAIHLRIKMYQQILQEIQKNKKGFQ